MNISAQHTNDPVEAEAGRLLRLLLHVECSTGRKWNIETCREIAPLTLEINRLKQEKNAVILTHSYVEPEIVYGVGDFKGDSYYLADQARQAKADVILFAGVVFMAETAKILSPGAQVIVPDRNSGCTLADSINVGTPRNWRKALRSSLWLVSNMAVIVLALTGVFLIWRIASYLSKRT
jgi:quinolinate synthase